MDDKNLNCVFIAANHPSVQKDPSLCANCGHCLSVCTEQIGLMHMAAGNKDRSFCINCGQCTAVCPEKALYVRRHWELVKEAVKDPDKVVIISAAPSVRVGLGECFGGEKGRFVEEKMVSALRALGADYVLDAAFAADLTIMEEGTEFLKRFLTGKGPLPQFTSCCPSWVKYAETFHPEYVNHLSSAKSPISMQGALIKTYFAKEKGIDPQTIVSVAIAPCAAKKAEIAREEMCSSSMYWKIPGLRDNDYVLTTAELAEWMDQQGLDLDSLEPSEFDGLMGQSSGAGLIFGNTGGVMEAAVRMAYSAVNRQDPPPFILEYESVRGMEQVKCASLLLGEKKLNLAVIYGTKAAHEMLESGEIKKFDFVEVMPCPGGCISGAGQPGCKVVPVPDSVRNARIRSLYGADQMRKIRNALDNGEVKTLYDTFLGNPMSPLSEQLLHTHYYSRA